MTSDISEHCLSDWIRKISDEVGHLLCCFESLSFKKLTLKRKLVLSIVKCSQHSMTAQRCCCSTSKGNIWSVLKVHQANRTQQAEANISSSIVQESVISLITSTLCVLFLLSWWFKKSKQSCLIINGLTQILTMSERNVFVLSFIFSEKWQRNH